MSPTISRERALLLAARQVTLLVSADALPDTLVGAELEPEATEVFDVNGDLLFWRVALRGRHDGYLDVAADARVGTLLMATAPDAAWHPEKLLEEARGAFAAVERREAVDEVRFVAYSYPKLAVQFSAHGKEVAVLELFTWLPVPERRAKEEPGNFERWSYLDALGRKAEKAVARFEEELKATERLPDDLRLADLRIERLDLERFIQLRLRRELHYSGRSGDHAVCYELRGQETNVWCVAASVQMLLDFYRYPYTQVRLAQELGLGTLANPNGLPYANDALVVTVIERLTGNALDATMFTTNPFSRFKSEINANRPLVSFIPGHSRTVAGFTETLWIFALGFRGLLVYDPWPPNAGVITRWENVDANTYRRTFTARVKLV